MTKRQVLWYTETKFNGSLRLTESVDHHGETKNLKDAKLHLKADRLGALSLLRRKCAL
ncbi:MAG: hypothetical protein IJ333_06220 [Clostridia bacterium]|nr:hypothetical protein [Clostridia bacterium]